jgi:hypothetical protein
VYIDRNRSDFANPFDHDRTDGDIRHKVPIHDVDVEPVGSGCFDRLNLFFKPAEVRGKDRRSDFYRLHLGNLPHAGGKKAVGIIAVRHGEKIFCPHHLPRLLGKITRGILQLKRPLSS